MASMSFDDEGLLEEPCLSCDKAYVEDIWHEWCCDEKECSYKPESEKKGIKITIEIPGTGLCVLDKVRVEIEHEEVSE